VRNYALEDLKIQADKYYTDLMALSPNGEDVLIFNPQRWERHRHGHADYVKQRLLKLIAMAGARSWISNPATLPIRIALAPLWDLYPNEFFDGIALSPSCILLDEFFGGSFVVFIGPDGAQRRNELDDLLAHEFAHLIDYSDHSSEWHPSSWKKKYRYLRRYIKNCPA